LNYAIGEGRGIAFCNERIISGNCNGSYGKNGNYGKYGKTRIEG